MCAPLRIFDIILMWPPFEIKISRVYICNRKRLLKYVYAIIKNIYAFLKYIYMYALCICGHLVWIPTSCIAITVCFRVVTSTSLSSFPWNSDVYTVMSRPTPLNKKNGGKQYICASFHNLWLFHMCCSKLRRIPICPYLIVNTLIVWVGPPTPNPLPLLLHICAPGLR